MTPKAKALQVVQRIAEAKGLNAGEIIGRSRKPLHDQVRVQAYVALVDELQWPYASIGRLFDRDRSVIKRTVERVKAMPARVEDPYEHIENLERQLNRLCGADLSKRLALNLGLKPWQASFLAIVIEAYPRALSRDQMCELYDYARMVEGGGRNSEGVSDEMCRAAISRVNAAFDAMALPRPLETRIGVGVTLARPMAAWFQNNYGRPFIVQAVA